MAKVVRYLRQTETAHPVKSETKEVEFKEKRRSQRIRINYITRTEKGTKERIIQL